MAEVAEALDRKLTQMRLLLKSGTIVDATIIEAPPSTKNAEQARSGDAPDPEGQGLALWDEGARGNR